MLQEISPGVMKKLKERVLSENLPSVAGLMRGLEGTYEAAVVKVAECVEANTFYRRYCQGSSRQAHEVLKYLQRQGDDALEELERKIGSDEATKKRARDWVSEMMNGGV